MEEAAKAETREEREDKDTRAVNGKDADGNGIGDEAELQHRTPYVSVDIRL